MKNKQFDEIIAKWMGLKEGVGKDFWTHDKHVVIKTTKFRKCRFCGKDIPNADMAEAYRKLYKKQYVEGSLSDPLEVPGDCSKSAPDYSSPLVRAKVLEKLLEKHKCEIKFNHSDSKFQVSITGKTEAEASADNLGDALRHATVGFISD